MTYSQFVAEVKVLLDEGRNLFGKNETHLDPTFRKWRHRLTTIVDTIENKGYSVACDISSRLFEITGYGDFSKREQIERYNQELQDTLNELETILDQFEKYGDPKAATMPRSTRQESKELEWPQKITLSWLWHHTPITLWFGFVGLLITVFLLGVAAGQSRLYIQIQALWKPVQAADTTAPNKPLKPTP